MSASGGKSSPCQTWVSKQKTEPIGHEVQVDIQEWNKHLKTSAAPGESSFSCTFPRGAQSTARFATPGGCEMPKCSHSKVKVHAVSF